MTPASRGRLGAPYTLIAARLHVGANHGVSVQAVVMVVERAGGKVEAPRRAVRIARAHAVTVTRAVVRAIARSLVGTQGRPFRSQETARTRGMTAIFARCVCRWLLVLLLLFLAPFSHDALTIGVAALDAEAVLARRSLAAPPILAVGPCIPAVVALGIDTDQG